MLQKFSFELVLTILTLLQQLGQSDTSAQQLLSGSVQIRAELGESSDLSILGQFQLHGTGHLLHGLGLSSRADS
ncbi:acetylglutamate semialdehyde dehydrogenase [Brachionus plicatilis]|uniref:Acetylglutamate semialdehyde dehydrogenase n=1 Tax=Brachionus plicatilis TaxID=10195 RepID=A0A3M7SV61_BRAPC|nr:acetylglutamate semialdehyde dehydrogenase [Brachionus plicatilis]